MKRRQYLAGVSGATAALAGCGGLLEPEETSRIRPGSSEKVEFVTHRLVTSEGTPMAGQRNAAAVNQTAEVDIRGTIAGTVKNVTDEILPTVVVKGWFYSETGLMGNGSISVRNLRPGAEEDFFIPIMGSVVNDEVVDYELAAEVRATPTP